MKRLIGSIRSFVMSSALVIFTASNAFAQSTTIDTTEIDEINERYKSQYEEIKKEAEELSGFDPSEIEAIIGKKLEVTTKRVDISFDTPSVDMKIREIKFHIAKTYMKIRKFSFDIPEFKWGRTNIGPVKLDLPKIYSKRVEIKTKIPEFKWDVTSIKTKIPEFYMHRQEIKFDIPEFKIVDVGDKINEIETRSKALEEKSARIEKAHKGELSQATSLSFLKVEAQIRSQMEGADEKFAEALKGLDEAIEQVEYYGINPEKVRNDDGSFSNLLEQRKAVEDEKMSVQKQFEGALKDIENQKNQALEALTDEG